MYIPADFQTLYLTTKILTWGLEPKQAIMYSSPLMTLSKPYKKVLGMWVFFLQQHKSFKILTNHSPAQAQNFFLRWQVHLHFAKDTSIGKSESLLSRVVSWNSRLACRCWQQGQWTSDKNSVCSAHMLLPYEACQCYLRARVQSLCCYKTAFCMDKCIPPRSSPHVVWHTTCAHKLTKRPQHHGKSLTRGQ